MGGGQLLRAVEVDAEAEGGANPAGGPAAAAGTAESIASMADYGLIAIWSCRLVSVCLWFGYRFLTIVRRSLCSY